MKTDVSTLDTVAYHYQVSLERLCLYIVNFPMHEKCDFEVNVSNGLNVLSPGICVGIAQYIEVLVVI